MKKLAETLARLTNTRGCVAESGSSSSTVVHVLRVSTASRDVLLTVTDTGEASHVVLVLQSSSKAWLPDGNSWIFRIVCVWPFGLLDYGFATLRCKI